MLTLAPAWVLAAIGNGGALARRTAISLPIIPVGRGPRCEGARPNLI